MKALILAALAALPLVACSAATMQRDQAKVASVLASVKVDVQNLQPVLDNICSAASIAGGAAPAIAPTFGASADDLANIQLAVQALGFVCADKDVTNLANDVTAAKGLYATIVQKSTAPAAAPVTPAAQ